MTSSGSTTETPSNAPASLAAEISAGSRREIVKSCRDIMRKDKGLSTDLDRLPMLTWIMFLKFIDDMEQVRETEATVVGKRFSPAIESPYRWCDWASKPDGITGDALLNFINIGVLVFWLGVIIIVGPTLDNQPNRMITFFGSMLGAYLLTDIFKILLAKQLRSKLTRERIFWVKKALGIILVICGIVLIVKGFLPKDKLTIEQGIEMMRE